MYCSNLSEGVLGFDCEWVNEKPVSLLQVATLNGVCVLFRLEKIGCVPPKLKVRVILLLILLSLLNHLILFFLNF